MKIFEKAKSVQKLHIPFLCQRGILFFFCIFHDFQTRLSKDASIKTRKKRCDVCNRERKSIVFLVSSSYKGRR